MKIVLSVPKDIIDNIEKNNDFLDYILKYIREH